MWAVRGDEELSTSPDVEELLSLRLPIGGELLFTSDLHLRLTPSFAARRVVEPLARLPAGSLVVLGGDVLELLDAPEDEDVESWIQQHRPFFAALAAAHARGVDVVWLVGDREVRLCRDDAGRRRLGEAAACRFALAADVEVAAGQRVWMEHGHRHDRYSRYTDPFDPNDTPLSHHLVREVLPAARSLLGPWLDDAAALATPASLPGYAAARLFYRQLLARWPLALFALVGAGLLRLAAVVLSGGAGTASRLLAGLSEVSTFGLLDAVVVGLLVLAAGRSAARRVAESGPPDAEVDLNRLTREELPAEQPGRVGYVTGHSQVAEVRDLGTGFYANPGSSASTVRALRASFGLPPVFRRSEDLGWLLLRQDGAGVALELWRASVAHPGEETWAERLAAPRPRESEEPELVAAWPQGPTTAPAPPALRGRSTRRVAAAVVAISAMVSIVSAVSPPSASRLRVLRMLLPAQFSLAANGLTVVVSVGLLVLALGLARGQRLAHRAALALLAVATVAHLVKAIDVEEALVTGATLAWLAAVRGRFSVPSGGEGVGRRLAVIAAAVVGGTALATVVLATRAHLPASQAVSTAVRELFGVAPAEGRERSHYVAAGLLGLGAGGVLAAGLVLLRRDAVARAGVVPDEVRALVLARGTDSLAYFALRGDKLHFLHGDSVVAYGVFGRVALVSPDPVGPPGDLERTITAFRAYSLERGWIMAVLAAAPDPARRYRALGLRVLYIGDEAIVWFDRFDLDLRGTPNKPLRGAVNRAQRAGYRLELHDAAKLPAPLRRGLQELATRGRRGEEERGFSMTLGRLFDPHDGGLLLAVAVGPDGRPGAFCQFVPAADAGGWSLDVMRRDPETPNGLMDFLLIETMRALRDRGYRGVGLNFATLRAVVDPEAARPRAPGRLAPAARAALHSLSEVFQIESLWQFDAKFNPEWRPRYLVFESPAHLPEIALAVARAESFWEIPVVGRFLQPS